MPDVTPVAGLRGADDRSAQRSAQRLVQDAADASLLRDRVTVAFGDQYIIGEEVGRGGMAIVYAATDVRLQRQVALKVLPPDLAFRADVRERFVREAQTAARLNHPHIVPIYAVHEGQGMVCFAMALVHGESLAARITRDNRPSFEYIAAMLEQVADALAYAHSCGVVHRDIKPDNVLIDRDSGRAMVTDFGIARAAESGSRLTQTGVAVGTPAFMSPEQATGDREIDGRSDVYSLGVVGYLMLAGRLPFEAATTPAMLLKHVSETPPPIGNVRPDAPRVLVEILERCLAKRPADRWENALQLRDALRGAIRGELRGEIAREFRTGTARRDTSAEAVRRAASEGARRYGHRHEDWAPQPADASPHQHAMSAPPPVSPLPPNASAREVREWERNVRAQRTEQKQRWKIERDAQRESLGVDTFGRTRAEQIAGFRTKVVTNVGMIGMLSVTNVVTSPQFPWAIFPAFGMSMGLLGHYTKLRARGITWAEIIGSDSATTNAPIPAVLPKPQRIANAVRAFRRDLQWLAASATVAIGIFAIGSAWEVDALYGPFVGSLITGGLCIGLVGRDWFRLRGFGVSARAALGDGWHQLAASADERPRDLRMRDELERLGGSSLLSSRFGDMLRAAVEDRTTIRETSERLSDADRTLVPDVAPTADALLERIAALAAGLDRLDRDLPGDALPQLDARIKALEAEPAHAPDRERRMSLLSRQRASLTDLDDQRATMQRGLESATLALRTLRLDMVKLRMLGVGAAINDVTSATQEARALSRDIGHAVDAVNEVRRL